MLNANQKLDSILFDDFRQLLLGNTFFESRILFQGEK
jgi:hypothetical protein